MNKLEMLKNKGHKLLRDMQHLLNAKMENLDTRDSRFTASLRDSGKVRALLVCSRPSIAVVV